MMWTSKTRDRKISHQMLKNKTECGGFQNKLRKLMLLVAVFCECLAGVTGCSRKTIKDTLPALAEEPEALASKDTQKTQAQPPIVDFNCTLDQYRPLKKEYHFYFTYKVVHPWWDAVGLGLEDEVQQYEDKGIAIYYEYLAPNYASAPEQIVRLSDASMREFDVIGVDVADVAMVTPMINKLIKDGHKVMTFSSSDASKEDGCNRIAYVGNTHNQEDGAALTEVLCERLGYCGKVAVLVGTKGAPCHEERALGVQEVMAKYPEIEMVEIAYDDDNTEKAYELTQEFLEKHSDLAGIVCCNMSNPVGAARAVVEAGKAGDIVIVGMDHDQEALHYLRDGVIYALGIQDCYSIGFDTIQVAVKIADGLLPGEAYPEKTEETTTLIYQKDAQSILQVLYGEIIEF